MFTYRAMMNLAMNPVRCLAVFCAFLPCWESKYAHDIDECWNSKSVALSELSHGQGRRQMARSDHFVSTLASGPVVDGVEEKVKPKESVELLASWTLDGRTEAPNARGWKATSKSVSNEPDSGDSKKSPGARFDGKTSMIEVDLPDSFSFGTDPFSISLWAKTESESGNSPGDLLSCYDPETRNGFNLGIYSHGGVTNSQPNSMQLHFGIDQARLEDEFTDHGRLGDAVYVFALCVYEGKLYAATCHAGKDQAGHVFRFEGADRWTDLGSPDKANSISVMAVFNGRLYVGSSKYRLAGSSLAESENPLFGGKVFCLGKNDEWEPCGTLSSETEAIASLIPFRGKLYASSLYRPAGFFRYEGGETWTPCPTPDGKRTEATVVFQDHLYATSYDEGAVFRFDGEKWKNVGVIPEATQTYGFGIYQGNLYVSEWPKARVFQFHGDHDWRDVGKLGDELEAMPLLLYNGKLYGGTLPSANVYRFDGEGDWSLLGQVDKTPNVKYRRAWSMAVYQGRLFVGTLPSGRVLSIEAGKNATYDRQLTSGWHHIVATRGEDSLKLFVDGKKVSESAKFDSSSFNLTAKSKLKIGAGAQGHFRGRIADLQIYRGELVQSQIDELAANPE